MANASRVLPGLSLDRGWLLGLLQLVVSSYLHRPAAGISLSCPPAELDSIALVTARSAPVALARTRHGAPIRKRRNASRLVTEGQGHG
jgi:hypothetical protein